MERTVRPSRAGYHLLRGVLAYVMEASEKGLISSPLRFGSPHGVSEAIDAIASREGLGDDMAQGVRRLSEKYGGASFAIHVKGLELPAYDPRGSWGQGLAYAVANRGGCHLSATLFPLEVFLGFLKPRTPKAKAHFVRFFESLYAAVNSLPTCLFTTYAYLLEAPHRAPHAQADSGLDHAKPVRRGPPADGSQCLHPPL